MRYSVLLPTRNGGPYLENCIRTILDQSYEDMELIVSDNANTDETKEVLLRFSEDSRLKVIRSEELVPVTENWNLALKASSGDYILMMGDDDCLLPDYFEKMDKILEAHQFPDCVTCNGYSFISPKSVSDNEEGFYIDPFYTFGPEFVEGHLSQELRLSLVKDMFRFKVRMPLNMQPHLVSRKARGYVEGDLFRAPFPDHFAVNALLMHVKSWVFSPQKLVVVGVSPKSFGHFFFGNKHAEGMAYLGTNVDFEGRLPGGEGHNGMYIWLTLLKTKYQEKLRGVKISRPSYVRRQIYVWYQQYKAGVAKPKDILKWFGLLSFGDWCGLFTLFLDKRSWQKFRALVFGHKKNQVNQVFEDAIPLKNISNIKEFAIWIADGH